MSTINKTATFPGDSAPMIGDPTTYSGTFIPTLWSGKLVEKFYDATVLAAIANTNYEGEISKYGDNIIIRQKPTIAIKNYTAGLDLVSERPSEDTLNLPIDQGKYWATELDDVMEVQADIDMLSMWADDASEQMKIEIDTDVLGFMLDKPDSTNRGATAGAKSGNIDLGVTTSPLLIDKSNVTDIIVRAGQALDENNNPEGGRYIVIPAWMAARIKTSELKDASLTGDGSSILRNGRLGQIDRFTIYMSNLLPNGVAGGLAADEFAVYFGNTMGLTFASQVTKVETLRAEKTFGTIMRGLQVYGRQVIKPTSIGQIICKANV
jgi:hypothetical protein